MSFNKVSIKKNFGKIFAIEKDLPADPDPWPDLIDGMFSELFFI